MSMVKLGSFGMRMGFIPFALTFSVELLLSFVIVEVSVR
jgi:hypothetical protein